MLAGLAVYFESRRSPPSMPFQSVAPVGTLPRKGSMARSSAVLGTGILLIALVVLVFSGTAGTGGSLAEKGHSEKHAAAAAKVAPKQKALTASQRAHDISEIKSLKAKIRQEQVMCTAQHPYHCQRALLSVFVLGGCGACPCMCEAPEKSFDDVGACRARHPSSMRPYVRTWALSRRCC